MAELLEAMSVKPVMLLVVDFCHLYSSVPVCPAGEVVFVNRAGSKGEQPVWLSAMAPPLVGLAQGGLTVYSQAPIAGYVKLRVIIPA